MRFKEQVEAKVDTGRKRNRVLKSLSTKSWGFQVESQRRVYVQYIRPAIDYASPSWTPWIADTAKKKLQVVQNQALRSIAGLAATCPVDFLHLETGIEPLEDRFRKNNMLMRERYLRLPEEDSRRVLMEKEARVSLKTRRGLRYATRDYEHQANFARSTSRPFLPSWRSTSIRFERVQLEKKKCEYEEWELKELGDEKIGQLEAEAIVYTDGSTNDEQEYGGAGAYIQNRRDDREERLSWPAGIYCSSYGAECVAFLKAVQWAETNGIHSIAVVTDSLSLHQALENDDWRDANDWIGEIKALVFAWGGDITLLWVPSHCKITGNDEADTLAEKGTKLPQVGVPVTHATAKARIRREKWKIGHERAKKVYGERRCPKFEVEKRWPRNVRSLYARLRTGHAKELRDYRYKIDQEDDPFCDYTGCGQEVAQTIQHVLVDCPALKTIREEECRGKVTPEKPFSLEYMTTHPEMCRKILSLQITGLNYTHKNAEVAQDVGRVRPQDATRAPVRAAPEQTSSEGSAVGEADAAAEATTTTGLGSVKGKKAAAGNYHMIFFASW